MNKKGEFRLDPTAFDNLKTVLEGAVYDADLQGRIAVVERRDLVDLARLFREYAISFRLNDAPDPLVVCTARLSLDFAELVNERLYHGRAGCRLALLFTLPVRRSSVCALIEGTLRTIWGRSESSGKRSAFHFHMNAARMKMKPWSNLHASFMRKTPPICRRWCRIWFHHLNNCSCSPGSNDAKSRNKP